MKFRPALLSSSLAISLPLAVVAQLQPALPASEPSAAEVSDLVQKFYGKTRSFKANFEQHYRLKAYNSRADASGQVAFQQPGRMSWRYANGNRVVSDGKVVTVYEAQNKRMYGQSMGQSQYPAALVFLFARGNLKRSLKLRKLHSKATSFAGHVLEGVPKAPTRAYEKMLLYVDGGTYQVRRVLLLDSQGNRNRFDFNRPRINPMINPREFNFKPPSGTQVIKP